MQRMGTHYPVWLIVRKPWRRDEVSLMKYELAGDCIFRRRARTGLPRAIHRRNVADTVVDQNHAFLARPVFESRGVV